MKNLGKSLALVFSRWKHVKILLLVLCIVLFAAFPLEASADVGAKIGIAAGALLCGVGLLGAAFSAGTSALLCAGVMGAAGALGHFAGDAITAGTINVIVDIITFIGAFVTTWLLTVSAGLLSIAVNPGIHSITAFPFIADVLPVTQGIANLLLVGIFIIIALATILGFEQYGLRRTLPLLIGIAILVNFSTVIAGLVIDSGQGVMNWFVANSSLGAQGMGDYFEQQLKMSHILSGVDQKGMEQFFQSKKQTAEVAKTSAALVRGIVKLVVIILGLLASYIFLRLALLLLMRYSVFWILIILAPLAFVLGILPAGKQYLKSWWTQLLNWSFLGPLTLFWVYMGALMWGKLNDAKFLTSAFTSFQEFGEVQATQLIAFPIVFLFFFYALSISKKMAGAAASALVDTVIGIGKGLTLGSAALIGGLALGGVGRGLGRVVRGEWLGKAGESLQQSGNPAFRQAGRFISGQRKQEVEKAQKDVETTSQAYEKVVSEESDDQLTSRFDRLKNSPTARLALVSAAVKKGRTLTPDMQEYGVKYSATRHPELGKAIKEQYVHRDDKVYNAKTGRISDYQKLIGQFRDTKDPTKIHLEGLDNNENVAVARGDMLTPQQEAFLLLGTTLDRGDRNRIGRDPVLFDKYINFINGINGGNEIPDAQANAWFGGLSGKSKYGADFLQKTFKELVEWKKNAAAYQANNFRGAPPTQQTP